MDKNRLIGNNNQIPWYLPEDLKYFKNITIDHPIIMGRKTFESIGKPLPGRQNIILTRDQNFKAKNCTVFNCVEEVLLFSKNKDIFIIGGEEIYKLFLPYVQKLYVTKIDDEFKGNKYFPMINENEWMLISITAGIKNKQNPYYYFYETFVRIEEETSN